MPLKTRDGVADAPIEPGLRMLCEPCETGPRWKLWRLIVPWKPLPMLVPLTLMRVARLERLDGHGLADDGLARAAELDEVPVRLDAVLLQVPELGLRQTEVGDRLVRELHGLVAVDVLRLHLDDRARPRLDHGDGRHDAGLRVEDLRHAELASDDSLHR